MRWFGEPWGAPGNALIERIDVPLGALCAACEKLIDVNDQGYEMPFLRAYIVGDTMDDPQWVSAYYHRDCLAEVLGLKEWRA